MAYTADDVAPGDIAIVGMALRVPGARNVSEFWSNLRSGVESIRTLSTDELDAVGEPQARRLNPNYLPRTADLPDMEMFDADFFGLSPKEAAIMDPQHRHFLECAWEAMEDAGRMPDSEAGPVGVFAGCGMGSYFYFNVCSNQALVDQVGMFLLRHTGNDKDFLSTRASFTFDLRGPSVNIQTACSTSLVAVHYACQSLLNGECDMALAGGVTIELPHRRGYVFQDGEILSPDGHCRPFDHRAAGTIFGSGVGVVALRRLSDAIADNDVIHAVIKSTAINNDGGSKAGYLAPSVTGQSEAVIEAQGLAGIDPATIGYVECHGTGTYLGDPIEIDALSQAFRRGTKRSGYCFVGSVKSNIGHLDTAAGVVGLIKAALTVKHGEIPPTLGFEEPNPSIDFASSPFKVCSKLEAWPELEGPRRAAINSLGVGGTNAHAIIQQSPDRLARSEQADDEPTLIVVSAKQKAAVDQGMLRLAAALESSPISLDDASYSLISGRRKFEHCRVLAVRGKSDAADALTKPELRRSFAHSPLETASGAVFLFPGGGAQYQGMARTLYSEEPTFKSAVDEGLSYLDADATEEIRRVWLGPSDAAAAAVFLRPSVQLPAILIVEIATARLWQKWGIQPQALIGHSMGENAAACLAGVMSYRDCVRLVRLRGMLFDTIPAGGMLSVPLDPKTLADYLPGDLDIASVNAPELCVVSGSNEALSAFAATLAERGIDATRIPIDIAAHSRMLEPILGRFEEFLRSIQLSEPRIPIISNRTGEPLQPRDARDPMYWVQHLRGTVNFAKGLAYLAADPNRVYIEVGPGRALSSLVKAQGSIEANQVVNSLPHPEEVGDDRLHFVAAAGRAWVLGLGVNLDHLWAKRAAQRVPLPTYPFQHKKYFIEPAAATVSRDDDANTPRKQKNMEDWGYSPRWETSSRRISPTVSAPETYLVFMDDAGVAAAVADRLRASGNRVVTVVAGDMFARRNRDEYVLCPEHGLAGYQALFSSLSEDGGVPSHIVHQWLVTADKTYRAGSSFFHRNLECGFYSLLHLAQVVGEVGDASTLRLTVVTNGMQQVASEGVMFPEKATVLGPALVIPKELAGARVLLLDLDLPWADQDPGEQLKTKIWSLWGNKLDKPSAAHAELIYNEVASPLENEVVAYRDGQRWVQSHQRLRLQQAEPKTTFRQRGVYLFTGGFGDLSLTIARKLAEQYQARIVLVGRTTLPAREDWRLVSRTARADDRVLNVINSIVHIEENGGQVLCVNADVSHSAQMESAIAKALETYGEINGVFHTAGVVNDDLMQIKSIESVEQVLAPKLHGTALLHDLLNEVTLDWLILFSSTSTDTAPAGQVDYVAANAYLNAYAESQRARKDRKTVAIHWGVWNQVGMAARALGLAAPNAIAADGDDVDSTFFERWNQDASGQLWLEKTLSTGKDWVLNEHRTRSGQAILPGTGYVELVLQAANAYGLGERGDIQDLTFIVPLAVEDSVERVLMTRFEPSDDHFNVIVATRSVSGTSTTTHVEAKFYPRKTRVAGQSGNIDVSQTTNGLREAADGSVLKSAQDRHLNFGPRWGVLRAVSIGDVEAVAHLRLAAEYDADLAQGWMVHPALLDIATGFAMDLIPGYDGSTLWVPATYGTINIYDRLPSEILSRVRLARLDGYGPDFAAFDVLITDMAGTFLLEAKQFIIKRMSGAFGSTLVQEKREGSSRSKAAAMSPAVAQLTAQVSQGMLPEEGFEALERALATGQTQPIVSSIDLEHLKKSTAAKLEVAPAAGDMFERPELSSDYVAPRTDVEATLVGFWRELLGVDQIGVHDNFFDLGGHSLIAVRLFRMIRSSFDIDLPISVLFERPTIAECGELIASQASPEKVDTDTGGDTANAKPTLRNVHVVPMQTGKSENTPLFICAGMFGNVLNLRHLALHLGKDRPVYGLQARGLYGDQGPHETFEEAARDLLHEVRQIQPHGPYLFAGFSGGGLTAYEMAQQLAEVGERVDQLIMLDTPVPIEPQFSVADRITMRLQDVRNEGASFLMNWVRNRIEWENTKRELSEADSIALAPESFHDRKIEAAFRRALTRYVIHPYAGPVTLLRPKPVIQYALSGGRRYQQGRTPFFEDNGWSRYIENLTIEEVPGDHDSMVLEPYVRVLVEKMRSALKSATQQKKTFSLAAE